MPRYIHQNVLKGASIALDKSTGVISTARDIVRNARGVCVLTGAGLSTDSGIPDYRSPGRPEVKSIQYNDFVNHHEHRQRYWARSMRGYENVQHASWNRGHKIISDAQSNEICHSLITQNVDGLHQAAGATDVVELHGSIHSVVCLDCQAPSSRADLQKQLQQLNPMFHAANLQDSSAALLGRMRPDGDSVLANEQFGHFIYPSCSSCGGMIKPDVVFFGESIPKERTQLSVDLVTDADVLIVAGTSCAVFSAFRLVRHALKRDADVIVITRGPTRADELIRPDLRFVDAAADVLEQIFS
eukprot:m.179853 g.179853  ORF g.179853 m.179853 type:complete len:300 (+) comp18400_c0_seq1:289-1188(+)